MATKINMEVFDEAVEILYGEGHLFDRDQALAEIQHAHLNFPDWQERVDAMDAEQLADFIYSYCVEPMIEANRAFEDAAEADQALEYEG